MTNFRYFWLKTNGTIEEVEKEKFEEMTKKSSMFYQHRFICTDSEGLVPFNINYIQFSHIDKIREMLNHAA